MFITRLILLFVLMSFTLLGLEPVPTAVPALEFKLEDNVEPDLEPAQTLVMQATKDIQYIKRPLTRTTLTSLDIYQPVLEDLSSSTSDDNPRPILLYIHGGGWALGDKKSIQNKAALALRNNWVFVSINYRLSPRVQHPEHARDAAAAIGYIYKHAQEFNADRTKIVIMGHSAGAHIAAIVASDESLLKEYNLAPNDLQGVVLLDGAGYDIPSQMRSKALTVRTRTMFENAFGIDPELWEQASPTLQANDGDSLPPLLAVHIDRYRSRVESINLVKAWDATGASAQRHYAPEPDHAGINRVVGIKNDPDSQVIEAFILNAFDAND